MDDNELDLTDPYFYVGKTLPTFELFRNAARQIRRLAHAEANHIHHVDGEDLADRGGIIVHDPVTDVVGPTWAPVDQLMPYLQAKLHLPSTEAPIRVTYEVRVVCPENAKDRILKVRVVTVQTDLISSTTSAMTAAMVHDNKATLFESCVPFLKLFLPMHENVGAEIHASDPVPRAFPSRGTVHMRTSVMMRFTADDDDALNRSVRKTAHKSRPTLLGPDGRPLR